MIRVGTYNTGDFSGENVPAGSEKAKEAFREVMNADGVQFWALQEDVGFFNPETEEMPYEAIYSSYKNYKRSGEKKYNYKAFLTDLPISEAERIYYTGAPKFGHPWFLHAQAEIEGVRHGVEFRAILTQSALDADGMREAKLEFTAPEALAGICVEYACGVFGATLGEVSFSGLAAEKLGAPIVAFLPAGEVISAEKINAEDGTAQTKIRLQSTFSVYEYIIDSKSGLPLSVIESTATGEKIMEIKIAKYETE